MTNPRFEEHCEYQHCTDISERIALNKEFDQMEQYEIDEWNKQMELEAEYDIEFYTTIAAWQAIEDTYSFIGTAWSRDNGTIYVMNIVRERLTKQILLVGYVYNYDIDKDEETYSKGSMYACHIQYEDELLEAAIEAFCEKEETTIEVTSWHQLICKHGFVSIHRVDDREGTYEVYKTPCGKHKLEYYFDTEEFKSSWYYKHNDTHVMGLKNKPNLVSHYILTEAVIKETPVPHKPLSTFESPINYDDDLPF